MKFADTKFMENKDRLFHLLHDALKDLTNLQETGGEVIDRIVQQYVEELQNSGFVPEFALSELTEDIECEAITIYRKLTYGHYDLKEFRLKRREI